MSQRFDGKFQPSIWQFLLVGVLVIITGALGLVLCSLLVNALLRYLAIFDVTVWAWRWWHMVGAIFVMLAWLIMVYVSAMRYRRDLESGRLWVTFGKFMLGQVCLGFLVLGGLELAVWLRG